MTEFCMLDRKLFRGFIFIKFVEAFFAFAPGLPMWLIKRGPCACLTFPTVGMEISF